MTLSTTISANRVRKITRKTCYFKLAVTVFKFVCVSISATFKYALLDPFVIGLIKLTEILGRYNHVHDVEVPEKVENVDEKEVFDAFRK